MTVEPEDNASTDLTPLPGDDKTSGKLNVGMSSSICDSMVNFKQQPHNCTGTRNILPIGLDNSHKESESQENKDESQSNFCKLYNHCSEVNSNQRDIFGEFKPLSFEDPTLTKPILPACLDSVSTEEYCALENCNASVISSSNPDKPQRSFLKEYQYEFANLKFQYDTSDFRAEYSEDPDLYMTKNPKCTSCVTLSTVAV